MSNKICFIIFLLCFPILASAQSLEIRQELQEVSAQESSDIVYDVNGNACALIKVESGVKGLSFSGAYLMGDVKESENGYFFAVAIPKRNTQKITVRHNNYSSVDIPLWYNNSPLKGGYLYKINIEASERKLASKKPRQSKPIVTVIDELAAYWQNLTFLKRNYFRKIKYDDIMCARDSDWVDNGWYDHFKGKGPLLESSSKVYEWICSYVEGGARTVFSIRFETNLSKKEFDELHNYFIKKEGYSMTQNYNGRNVIKEVFHKANIDSIRNIYVQFDKTTNKLTIWLAFNEDEYHPYCGQFIE